MTPAQYKALTTAVFELQASVRRIDGAVEGLLAAERERNVLLGHIRTATDHVLRLIRQKEVLLQLVGTTVLDRRSESVLVGAEEMADLERIAREIRGH